MSQLEVDKIVPQSGTTLTIGDSGDTVNFADGTSIGIDTNTLYIDSTNNRVGIGTSSPSSALHIENDIPNITLTDSNANQVSLSARINFYGNNGSAGYIGMLAGNLEISHDHAKNIIFETSATERMRIKSDGSIGIGTTAPEQKLQITDSASGSVSSILSIENPNGGSGTGVELRFVPSNYNNNIGSTARWSAIRGINGGSGNPTELTFLTNSASGDPSERMRIDSSGNLLVGKTVTTIDTDGVTLLNSGTGNFTRSSDVPLNVNRKTDDGTVISVRKDGTEVGSIKARSSFTVLQVGSLGTGISGTSTHTILPSVNNARSDNTNDLGDVSYRWKDIYLSGGLYVGGTGTANKLDDYEEGTWSPSIQASGNHFSSITLGNRIGYYTKVGRLVTAHFRVSCTAVTVGSASGALQVESLPFTASNLNTNLSHTGSLYYLDHINFDPAGTFGTANIGLRTNANTDKGTIQITRNNNSSAGVAAATAINSNSEIQGVLIYFTD